MHRSTLEHLKSAYTHILHASSRVFHPFGPRTIRPPVQAQVQQPQVQQAHVQQAQVHSQLLCSLPLEIRHQLYAYVLDSYGTVQHLECDSRDGKIKHVRCPTSSEHTRTLYPLGSLGEEECLWYHHEEGVQDRWQVVPLLLSCRQV
jgi:hypothetical protein